MVRQRRPDGALLGPGAPLHGGRRACRARPAGDERARRSPAMRATPMRMTIVPPTRATASQSTVPVAGAGVLVAGDDGERGRRVAQGHRDAGVGGHGDGRGDAGHDLEGDAGRRAGPAASSPPRANTNGSPPLSRTTVAAGAAVLDEQRVDLVLGHRRAAGRLADADALGAGRRQVEQRRDRQPVVDHHVGPAQHLGAPHGEQPGVARARRRRGRRSRLGTIGPDRESVSGSSSAAPPVVEQVAGDGRARRPRGRRRRAAWRSTTWPSSEASRRLEPERPVAVDDGVGAGREVAVAAQLGQEGPLGVDARGGWARARWRPAAAGVGVVVGPALDGQRALADLGQHDRRRRAPRRSRSAEPEPLERDGGHDDGVEVGRLGQPGGDVAPQPGEGEVGRRSASCARRRTEPVATVAPGAAGRRARDPTSASRGSPRSGTAASTSPSAVTDGRSLAECTARSARPSSTAACTSLTNTPLPPISQMGTSGRRSPVGARRRPARRSSAGSAARSSAATCSACQRASALPAGRDPERAASRLQVEEVAEGLGQALALGRCRRRP